MTTDATRTQRWNFLALGIDYGMFQVGLSFASVYSILPLFVHHLSTSNLAVGLIPAIRSLGIYIPPILIAAYVEKLPQRLPFLLRVTIPERLPFLALALLVLPMAAPQPVWLLVVFYVLIFIQTASAGFGTPVWLDLISRAVSGRLRGRFFGLWGAMGGIGGVAGGSLAVFLLHQLAWPLNFSACFAICFFFMIISYISLALTREPVGVTRTHRMGSIGYARQIVSVVKNDRPFSVFLLANGLATVASTAIAFFTIVAVRDLHLSDSSTSTYAVVLTLATIVGNVIWGYLGDRVHHRRVLESGVACAVLAALLATAPTLGVALGPIGYGGVFVLAGLSSSATLMASMTMPIEFGQADNRPTYIGIATLAAAPFAVCAPLLGGWLADVRGYPTVFVLSAMAGCGALVLLIAQGHAARGHALSASHPVTLQQEEE